MRVGLFGVLAAGILCVGSAFAQVARPWPAARNCDFGSPSACSRPARPRYGRGPCQPRGTVVLAAVRRGCHRALGVIPVQGARPLESLADTTDLRCLRSRVSLQEGGYHERLEAELDHDRGVATDQRGRHLEFPPAATTCSRPGSAPRTLALAWATPSSCPCWPAAGLASCASPSRVARPSTRPPAPAPATSRRRPSARSHPTATSASGSPTTIAACPRASRSRRRGQIRGHLLPESDDPSCASQP